MLAICRIPCPLRSASECYIYTYLDYLNFLYIKVVILLYARTCWPLPYPMSVAHRKCKLNFNPLVLLMYVWTRWPHAVYASVNLILTD